MTIVADRDLVEALLPAVLAAGRIEMSYFTAGVKVETKADATPVTAADHEAEVILVEGLSKVAPGIPVIAEESVAAGKVPETEGEFFLVDPLDGTRAFIAGKIRLHNQHWACQKQPARIWHHLCSGFGKIFRYI